MEKIKAFITHPLTLYTLGYVLLGVYLVYNGVTCENSPMTCFILLSK